LIFYALAIFVVLLDQLAKWWIVHRVGDRSLCGEVLRFTVTHNTGAAFGLFPGARIPFIVISVAAAAGLVYAHHALAPSDRRRPFLALILGGNLGNLADRLRVGRVTDFIDMGIGTTRWPVYNVADIAVVCGAVGLGWLLLRDVMHERAPRSPVLVSAADDSAGPEETAADAR